MTGVQINREHFKLIHQKRQSKSERKKNILNNHKTNKQSNKTLW